MPRERKAEVICCERVREDDGIAHDAWYTTRHGDQLWEGWVLTVDLPRVLTIRRWLMAPRRWRHQQRSVVGDERPVSL